MLCESVVTVQFPEFNIEEFNDEYKMWSESGQLHMQMPKKPLKPIRRESVENRKPVKPTWDATKNKKALPRPKKLYSLQNELQRINKLCDTEDYIYSHCPEPHEIMHTKDNHSSELKVIGDKVVELYNNRDKTSYIEELIEEVEKFNKKFTEYIINSVKNNPYYNKQTYENDKWMQHQIELYIRKLERYTLQIDDIAKAYTD